MKRLLNTRMIKWICCLCLLTGTVKQNFAATTQIAGDPVSQRVYLSGSGPEDAVRWDFYCTAGRNAGKWATIPVPSNWEQQGFGTYNYGFDKDSARGKESGLYKHRFHAPASWKGKVVELVFEGVMTDAEVKINGKIAGEKHQGAFYAFRYDISKLLQWGKDNVLEVKVDKHSSNESVNDAERRADFWIFGGIFRPVFLEVHPKEFIRTLNIDAKANGDFSATVIAAGNADRVEMQLVDKTGKTWEKIRSERTGKNGDSLFLKGHFRDVLPWSAEFPHLYEVKFTLLKNGKEVHALTRKIGFRTIELRMRDGIYVNGVKMKFKGVNRHSFHPETGRATGRKTSIEDVLLMKEMNMNAVRMSHYPPDAHFLEVCDSIGLYVMDELAGWHGHYDTKTGTPLVKEMLEHDRNHPSIILWANGNEGGHNFDLDPLFAKHDLQQRPVVHPWQLFNGIETQHYREYNYGIGSYDHGHDILMPTEFLHGMYDGGHGAGLEDYWEAMWHNPLSAGGFLWDFADQGIVRTDKNGMVDTDGNHGADGIVGPYKQKEGSFYTIKEVWSPLHFEKKEITPDFDGVLLVENRYAFTNTDKCSFTWELGYLTEGKTNTLKGTAKSPHIAPGEKGKLALQLPLNWHNFDVLYVTAKDPHGRELFTWSFPVALPFKTAKAMVKKQGTLPLNLDQSDSVFHIKAGPLSMDIHRRTGMLTKLSRGNELIPFSNGPVLQEGENNFSGFSARAEKDSVVIISSFDRKTGYNTLEWTVFSSGWVRLKTRYFPASYFTSFVGVNFSFPEADMKAVTWAGKGPYRVWKNRMKGGTLGVWNKAYNNTETGELPFQYPEFKGYHANMYWCRFGGKQHNFTVVTDQEDVFFRLFTPAWKKDPYNNYVLNFPSGDISFMQGISGIGTKTQKTENTGPMGGKHIFYDYEKDPSRAKELVLYFNFLED